MRLVWGTVEAIAEETASVQRVAVHVDGAADRSVAVVLIALTGRADVGERVLCNTTAVELGLGTGGEHFVLARAGEGVALDDPVAGHIMKLRYTPLQRDVTAVEEPASPHHAVMSDAVTLDGMPVVCCGLHSQMAMVAAGIKEVAPERTVAYLMTDDAALPLAVSRLVPALVSAGLVDATVTCGQAFGGDHEAINLYSGLLAARHACGADVAIVALGPGIVGTATPFGHGGVAQGEALNAVASLGGRAVAALRVSFADPRARHVPVSHQTLCALTGVALAPALVAVPTLDPGQSQALEVALDEAGVWRLHEPRFMASSPLPDMRGIGVTTMGRGPEEDAAFFHAAAAAGRLAASLLDG